MCLFTKCDLALSIDNSKSPSYFIIRTLEWMITECVLNGNGDWQATSKIGSQRKSNGKKACHIGIFFEIYWNLWHFPPHFNPACVCFFIIARQRCLFSLKCWIWPKLQHISQVRIYYAEYLSFAQLTAFLMSC